MAKSERLAVIGHPVSHSLSPQLYQFMMTELGIEGKCFRATGLRLPKVLKMLHELKIQYFNVTHPYKEKVQEHLTSMSLEAQKIGAVNSIIEDTERGWIGHNTDHAGVLLSLLARFQILKGSRVLIAGAGGAAKAAAFSLCRAGAVIFFTNRNPARGEQIAKDFFSCFHPLGELSSLLSSIDIVIWTIPGYPPFIDLPLQSNQVVLDANYKAEPPQNYFGKAERLDGLNWLIYQGWQSLCSFFGRNFEVDSQFFNRSISFLQASRELKSPRRVVLLGFMGAGKTTVGRQLSARMEWDFLDVDDMCEEAAGKSISEIFQDYGEETFRRLEKEQIEKSLHSKDTIIALGGGALMTPGISQMLKDNAFTIWLYQPQETIKKRCALSSQRPLFDLASFKKRMVEREPSYLLASDLIIDSEGGSVEETADFLIPEFSFLD
jgi:shikimate 5-dehydrogenase/shikimate kinase